MHDQQFKFDFLLVTYYLKESGVLPCLEQLGFNVTGYGCMTCIGNSGPLDERVAAAIEKNSLVCCGVLSGNRNFEGRIHPLTRANYLGNKTSVLETPFLLTYLRYFSFAFACYRVCSGRHR